ncbi:hypothetical protein GW17_00037230 [Ensete ventricosum]|nr:hypothetical protein GW17_00037230 [Ensete ventricosum]
MRLGTPQECVESSSRVSGACQDGAREFARTRLRLTGRLSGIAEKLTGSIGPGSDNAVGSRRKFARRFVEGIKKLTGNAKGDCWEEDRRTCRKIIEGYRIMRKLYLI